MYANQELAEVLFYLEELIQTLEHLSHLTVRMKFFYLKKC